MFCPQCGHQIADGARFCPKCGYSVAQRQQAAHELPMARDQSSSERQLMPAPKRAQGRKLAQRPSRGGGLQGGPAPTTDPKRRSKVVPLIIGVVALALLVGGGFFVYKTFFDHRGSFVEPQLKEEEPNHVSPKEGIEVVDLKLDTDQLNRYVITATVRNTSDQAYDVKLDLSATMHSSDKYGEEVAETTSNLGLCSVTPYTRADGASVTLYDLEPGERQVTLYTSWDSVEEFLSSEDGLDYSIRSVSLPDAQARTRFDHNINADGGIKDIQMTYTQDGKLRGSFANDTGMYLDEVTIASVAKNKEGLPAVYRNGARPYGAVVESLSVDTLKPGDTGEFEVYVGEGYQTIDPLDVRITPDPNKSTFS